ncbi:MAG: hypothetical protein PHD41_02275 [Methanosarcinaceae archaeon]|nr:hypothetical protein [Methanosarcinaceae archaeon]MDD4332411.1 hypothetical protein [Methanosarcinaceae archaeon]MDD4748915.1 hypothetical protein [Methanosarcinaceae archaeon]
MAEAIPEEIIIIERKAIIKRYGKRPIFRLLDNFKSEAIPVFFNLKVLCGLLGTLFLKLASIIPSHIKLLEALFKLNINKLPYLLNKIHYLLRIET